MLKPPKVNMTYHDLLRLGEEIQRVTVQLQLAQLCDRDDILRDYLGGIQNIKAKSQLIFFFHDLYPELRRVQQVSGPRRYQQYMDAVT